MNAKKETAYIFADELIALHDACPEAAVTYIANLEDRGLPKVREDAARILAGMRGRGLEPELVGALDGAGQTAQASGSGSVRSTRISPSWLGFPTPSPRNTQRG